MKSTGLSSSETHVHGIVINLKNIQKTFIFHENNICIFAAWQLATIQLPLPHFTPVVDIDEKLLFWCIFHTQDKLQILNETILLNSTHIEQPFEISGSKKRSLFV